MLEILIFCALLAVFMTYWKVLALKEAKQTPPRVDLRFGRYWNLTSALFLAVFVSGLFAVVKALEIVLGYTAHFFI